MSDVRTPEITAANNALAEEHAAIYDYSVLGVHLSGAALDRARAAYNAHRERRDMLSDLIADRGGAPVRAYAAYALLRDVASPKQARAALASVEGGIAEAYAALVEASSGSLRTTASAALTSAALSAVAWGAAPTAFPGLR